ncbi:acylphosphatase [Methanolobus halotolerans]|uniref:acylphosphatase n=1 Tax=Methanolobus halotolerans TaxID=2052935 RepID=A0A4E0PVF2_9EURY|nr:acylphosphatase [Methanolobus halotolerans]TGC08038.1 acylphosphatase [Methanolobus halotolerans]
MQDVNTNAEAHVSATVLVSGRVQGVYFRKFTRDNATDLGLMGFVENLPDGRVKVVAEGRRADIEKLISLLEKGPSRAVVENVDVSWSSGSGEFADFSIRK